MVFPAPAGMNLNAVARYMAKYRVPRACGDEPKIDEREAGIDACSPRLRG